jgi:hypothetical protein
MKAYLVRTPVFTEKMIYKKGEDARVRQGSDNRHRQDPAFEGAGHEEEWTHELIDHCIRSDKLR